MQLSLDNALLNVENVPNVLAFLIKSSSGMSTGNKRQVSSLYIKKKGLRAQSLDFFPPVQQAQTKLTVKMFRNISEQYTTTKRA
jgi:hypothetical protein